MPFMPHPSPNGREATCLHGGRWQPESSNMRKRNVFLDSYVQSLNITYTKLETKSISISVTAVSMLMIIKKSQERAGILQSDIH